MSDKPTTEWPDGLAEAIPDDVATGRGGMVKEDRPMGYSARANETARKAAAGELMSRGSLMGAMDHALEVHASALRLLESKIVALKERVEKLEAIPILHDWQEK
jgi:hypothetical protein